MSWFPRAFWAIPVVVAGIALASCTKHSVDTGPPKPVIAASIFPVASLIGQLTDGWADVVTLLPDGALEHAFEMTADQVRQLSRADLLVVVGNGLDAWAEPKPGVTVNGKQPTVLRMADLIGNLGEGKNLAPPDATKIDASQTNAPQADVSPASKENYAKDFTRRGPPPAPLPDAAGSNNHLWLDPVLAGRFVSVVASQLSTRYPEHRSEIERAAAKLSADLRELDQSYRTELSTVRRRELITFHNAFDLIAHRYGLVIVARLTDIESDPHGGITPASYLAAIKAIKQYSLMAIYSEPEFSAQEVASIQRETGVEVLTLDPLGGPTIDGYRTYQEMMRSNLRTLVKGQGLEGFGPPDMLSIPKTSGKTIDRPVDDALDMPLRVPGTTKKPKSKEPPHLFSDPVLRFPPTVPKTPDLSNPAPSHTAPPSPSTSPFQP